MNPMNDGDGGEPQGNMGHDRGARPHPEPKTLDTANAATSDNLVALWETRKLRRKRLKP